MATSIVHARGGRGLRSLRTPTIRLASTRFAAYRRRRRSIPTPSCGEPGVFIRRVAAPSLCHSLWCWNRFGA